MEQAKAFLAENEALEALLSGLSEKEFTFETGFKDWTINNILRHLHVWNLAAEMSLKDEAAFMTFFEKVKIAIVGGAFREFESNYLDGISGRELVILWQEGYKQTTTSFDESDPKARVVWAGPNMSVRSSITARLMETWAHAQAIYDRLGVDRQNKDHIKNIVVLGANTFSWTYKVRGMAVPETMPYLVLTAPSGALWTFGEDTSGNRIEGQAEHFCQVVTQCRNIADVPLDVRGPIATEWMSMAQCFAGGVETPPPPGARRKMT